MCDRETPSLSGSRARLGRSVVVTENNHMGIAAQPPITSAPPCHVAPLRIGPLVIDPPVLQAPMAGFTNYAFRQMVRHYGGAGLLATEMVSARGFA